MNERAARLRQMRINGRLPVPPSPPEWVTLARRSSSGLYGLSPQNSLEKTQLSFVRQWGRQLLMYLVIAVVLSLQSTLLISLISTAILPPLVVAGIAWSFFAIQARNAQLRAGSIPETASLVMNPGQEQVVIVPRLQTKNPGDRATLVLRERSRGGSTFEAPLTEDLTRLPLILVFSESLQLYQTTLRIPDNALPSYEEGKYQLQWGLELERTLPNKSIDLSFYLLWVTPHKKLVLPE